MKKNRKETMKEKEQSRSDKDKKADDEAFQSDSLTDEDSSPTDAKSEDKFMCSKKLKRDELIMVPILRKNWMKNVAKLTDKSVASSGLAMTLIHCRIHARYCQKEKVATKRPSSFYYCTTSM